MVRRRRPESHSRWFERSIITCTFLLLYIPIVDSFPVSICIPLKCIIPKSGQPGGDLRLFDQSHGREDDSNDASETTNDGVDRVERDVSPMKSAVKSSSMDLTDRFKYKVNALMGTYDPIDETKDTENVQGNILNAILNFPVTYTFHVVGRTAGDIELQSRFLEQVKDIMEQEESVKYEVIPRGNKFTKISIVKQVVNADEISEIYTRLSQLDLSIMQF